LLSFVAGGFDKLKAYVWCGSTSHVMSAAWETFRTCLLAAISHTKKLIAKCISGHILIHFAIGFKSFHFTPPSGGKA